MIARPHSMPSQQLRRSLAQPGNWDDFRFLLAVAESSSFAGAARRLSVSQPTVSRRISQLEGRLGMRLFETRPEGQVLSAQAERLVEIAREIEDKAARAHLIAAGQQECLAGTVNLTMTRGMAERWFAANSWEFANAFPQIELNVLVDYSLADLMRREADIAVRLGEPRAPELTGRRVGYARCGLFASLEYLERMGHPDELDQLAEHEVIGSLDAVAEFVQNRDLKTYSGSARPRLASNDATVQLAMAEAGAGIVCVPCYMVRPSDAVVRILADKYQRTLDLWVLTHRDLVSAKPIRATLDFLYRLLEKDRAVFAAD